ncbi:hypothetical protein JCM17380_27500 [Desulfosporosinus burensis]
MTTNKVIVELEQMLANQEATLVRIREDNEIWNQIFIENSWGMVVCDANSGELLKVNPRYAEMHGYCVTELIGKSIYKLLCAPGHDQDLLHKGPILYSGHYGYKSVHIRKDGSLFPVHIENYEVTVNTQCLRVISIWDATEIELKEKELNQYRESLEELVKFRTDELEHINQQLRSEIIQKEAAQKKLARVNQDMIDTLDSMGDYFIAVNRQWIITFANKAMNLAREKNGIYEPIVGTNYWETYKLGNKVITSACLDVMNKGQPKRIDAYANFVGHWVEASIYPTESGISVFFRNIDERRKNEKAIEEEHHRLYSLFNNFPGLVYVQEENYKIRFANASFQAKFGPCIDQHCFEVIAGLARPCQDCMTPMIYRSNTAIWKEMVFDNRIYEVYSQPYIDVDGSRLVFKVLIDITVRKSADRELARLERLNMIGEMAAEIAHEVRNPLTTVRGFLQLLTTKDEANQYHEFYHLMIGELDRANLIITDFLSLAKDKSSNFSPINITGVVQTLAPLLSADANNQDKKIALDLVEVSDTQGNENELRQLILNLARNGLEAMQGGTTLTIQTYQLNQRIILKVSDQGGGVDPDILGKLGTPFLTTKEQGTGLGLAICQSIAARHKASIDFESDLTGTIVTVKFLAIINN